MVNTTMGWGFLLGSSGIMVPARSGSRTLCRYALEGVMNTSGQYHQPVLEALSAFVRDGSKTDNGDAPPATDIQAALTVIGRRAAIGTGSPDLSKAHIPNAILFGANLTSADLRDATVTQEQLDQACGTNVNLDPGLTIKPCP